MASIVRLMKMLFAFVFTNALPYHEHSCIGKKTKTTQQQKVVIYVTLSAKKWLIVELTVSFYTIFFYTFVSVSMVYAAYMYADDVTIICVTVLKLSKLKK